MSATELIRKGTAAINAHDVDAFAAIYAPNATVRDPMYAEPLEGREAIHQDMRAFVGAFPDLAVSVDQVIDAGENVAYRVSMSGTHQGPLVSESGDIPPTGKRVQFGGAIFSRLDGQGRILEEYRYFDLAGLLSQIGVTV